MSKPVIIGLYGAPRSGKNTTLDLIRSVRPKAAAYSLSDAIKSMSHDFAGTFFDPELKDVPLPALSGHAPRDLYIYMGNLDKFIPDIWSRITAKKIRYDFEHHKLLGTHSEENPGVVAVIESVGKQPQWSALVELLHEDFDMVLCGVERPGFGFSDNRTPIFDNHTNYLIRNNGTEVDLYTSVQCLVGLAEGPRSYRAVPQPDNGYSTQLVLPDSINALSPFTIEKG